LERKTSKIMFSLLSFRYIECCFSKTEVLVRAKKFQRNEISQFRNCTQGRVPKETKQIPGIYFNTNEIET